MAKAVEALSGAVSLGGLEKAMRSHVSFLSGNGYSEVEARSMVETMQPQLRIGKVVGSAPLKSHL